MKILRIALLASVMALPSLGQSQQFGTGGRNERGPGKAVAGSCTAAGSMQLENPRIEITKTSGSASAQRSVRILGFVEGVCLSEAGYYQNGQSRQSISVDTVPTFKRYEFELNIPSGTSRDIRVYNTAGGRASYPLPDTDISDDPLGIGVARSSDNDF